jgi:DNA polymerase-3 subunit epsilon/CBS domain-containing protein
MTRRAAQLAEIQLLKDGTGPPPTAYAVLVLGSAGRGESQLAADQDNAIVYERGAEGGPEDTYFEKIGAIVSDILDAAGVPYCQGGVMAKNRAWRKSKSDWLATIDDWLSRQRPQDLLNVDIFFDALPVHGDLALGEEVWSYAYLHAHAARDFQNSLIEVTRNPGSPFKLMGGLRLDDKGRIDLKRFGLMSLYTSARVLSIRHDVRSRSTLERLRGVAAKGIGSPEIIESVLDAQRLLLGAIISQQLRDAEEGIPPSSRVDPRRLERRFAAQLKPSLKAVNEVVGLVGEGRL